MSIFPFTVKAYDTGHHVQSPRAHKSFMRGKPEKATWYAFDVTINSRSHASFTVYDMADMCHGGIGERLYDFDAALLKDEADEMISAYIKKLSVQLEAEERRIQKEARIAAIYSELMAEAKDQPHD